AQVSVLGGALRLLLYAIVPMIVMLVPMVLLLVQIALWYQKAPLKVGDETVITMKVNGEVGSPMPEVELQPAPAVGVLVGPGRAASKREICWSVQGREAGTHTLVFHADGQNFEKQLSVGSGYMRVSERRPEWKWSEVLFHPKEPPFRHDSVV